MLQRIDADRGEAAEIELLQVRRARLQDHLILVIMLEPVRILAVAAVGRAAAGLDEGGLPRIGAERAQGRRRVEGARAHLHVVGLEDDAALLAPIIVERQDQPLERERSAQIFAFAGATKGRFALAHGAGWVKEAGIREGFRRTWRRAGAGRSWPDCSPLCWLAAPALGGAGPRARGARGRRAAAAPQRRAAPGDLAARRRGHAHLSVRHRPHPPSRPALALGRARTGSSREAQELVLELDDDADGRERGPKSCAADAARQVGAGRCSGCRPTGARPCARLLAELQIAEGSLDGLETWAVAVILGVGQMAREYAGRRGRRGDGRRRRCPASRRC